MECPRGMRAVPGSGIFPSSIQDLPAKSPQPPILRVDEVGYGVGAPLASLPSSPARSWPPPSLPAGMQLLYCSPLWDSSSPAPPPPHTSPAQPPSNFQIPPPPPPFGKPGEGRVPTIPVCSVWTLTNTPTPTRPGMLEWRRVWYQTYYTGLILHPPPPPPQQHTQTHALHQISG